MSEPDLGAIPQPVIQANCTGCGRCVAACRSKALSLDSALPNGFGPKRAVIAPQLCSGCMECLPACPHQALLILQP